MSRRTLVRALVVLAAALALGGLVAARWSTPRPVVHDGLPPERPFDEDRSERRKALDETAAPKER